jgi:hypothetical protein
MSLEGLVAEREGFEPPIAFRLCLISSQVHSTGLCHLSALLRYLFCCPYRISPFFRLPAIEAGVRSGVTSVFLAHQPVHGRSLVLGSEMGVAHHHLERPVPEQLCDGAQIHPGHHESTGKSMAVAMPGIPLDPGRFEYRREPAPRPLQSVPAADGREDRIVPCRPARAAQLLQGTESDRVQRNGTGIPRSWSWVNESAGVRSRPGTTAGRTARSCASRYESKAKDAAKTPASALRSLCAGRLPPDRRGTGPVRRPRSSCGSELQGCARSSRYRYRRGRSERTSPAIGCGYWRPISVARTGH